MLRQKSFRSFLTICCSFALLLYIAAPLFANMQTQTQQNQPPSTQENRTMHEPPSAGGTTTQTTTKTHKSKKTKKSHRDQTNARQKPGTSTGTDRDMNQGTSPDMNKGKTQQPDTYGQTPNSGGAGVNPDKSPR
jgi:cytoskeletal protein RodZ